MFPKVVCELEIRVRDAAAYDAASGEYEEEPDAVVVEERVEELDDTNGDDEELCQRPEPDDREFVEDGQPCEEELSGTVGEEVELVVELAAWGIAERV